MKIFFSVLFGFFVFALSGQVTYVVNTTDDLDDGVCDGVHCSIYEAINESNIDNAESNITFNIINSDTIYLTDSLVITETSTMIDGVNLSNNNNICLTRENNLNSYFWNCFIIRADSVSIQNFNFYFDSPWYTDIHIFYSEDVETPAIIDIYGSDNIVIGNNLFEGEIKASIKLSCTNSYIINNSFKTGYYNLSEYLPDTIFNGTQIHMHHDIENLVIDNNIFLDKSDLINHSYNYSSSIYTSEILNIDGLSISNNIFSNQNIGFYLKNGQTLLDIHIQSNYFDHCTNAIHGGNISSAALLDSIAINYNKFYSNSNAIYFYSRSIYTMNNISDNFYSCNNNPILLNDYNNYTTPIGPNIKSVNINTITGTSNPNEYIEIYYSDTCQTTCQGLESFNNTYADINGDWSVPTPNDLFLGSQITALKRDSLNRFSKFSSCYIVLPDDCIYTEILPVNINPCSTTGIVLDLDQMTSSTPLPTSAYSSTFAGNDAWYKIGIPPTGNVLIRSNINNQVSPVIELYKGNCNNLIIQGATAFNDTIQEMVFQDSTGGDTLYLRVWDNNNLKVNAGESLLHLTAHELGVNKDEWEICDEENAYLLGNPTIISEKDANSFILEFPANASAQYIQDEKDELEAQGLVLEDECLCSQNPLQLWKAGNPVDMETRRKSAIGRGNVDTVNYNYIFEAQEFQVNAYAIGQQYDTDVSMNPDGNFVMCWIDEQRRHNYGRLYNSSGNPVTQEFRIGDRDYTQFSGQISMESNGDFITVWHEIRSNNFILYGRQYHASGVTKGPQFDISSSSTNPSAKYGANGSIDTDASGNFIVTWHVGRRIFVQLYNSSAVRLGTIKEVGSTINNDISPRPSVSVNNTGDFIIVWNGADTEENGIYAQRYNANGVIIGPTTLVNTNETKDQVNPDVTLFDDGSYIITWQSFEQEAPGKDYGVYMRRFDSSGTPLGIETLVNSYIDDAQKNPSISGFDDGRFFIAWDSYGQDGTEEGVYGQLFAADGSLLGGEFKLNTFTDPEQEEPATATNGTNLLIGSWVDGANDGSYKGIFAQRYEIAGPKAIPIGTATPSFLLGEEVPYTPIVYSPTDSVSRVRVAIVDTGIDPGHPYLANTIWNNQQISGAGCHNGDIMGYDYYNDSNNPLDVDGHGTQVNGIVAQEFNPEVQLEMMNVKFHEADKGKVFDALCGLYYAVDNGADVINLSWGFEASEYPSILNKALTYAADSNDVLIITTAGNTSKNNDIVNKYPANLNIDNMIVVTAYEISSSTGNIRLANYASYGENNVDIAAPGFVETTFIGDSLALSAGTSLAAPWVTRTAATIRGLYPVLTAADVKDCIMSTARPEPGLLDRVVSDGILDHNAALACARSKAMDCMGIDLFITVNQTIDTTYRSDAWVNSDATVNNNTDVKMYGAEYVGLHPDFEVELGAEYLADIDDCAPNNEPMDFVSSGSDDVLFSIEAHSPNTGKIKSKFYSDGVNPVSININDAKGGTLHAWKSEVLEIGWYEKIIDVAEVKSGNYEIEYRAKEYQAARTVLLKKERMDR